MSRCASRLVGGVLLLIALGAGRDGLAADPGRLFYTPAQRAQLEAARGAGAATTRRPTPAQPLRFDGVIIRSDGTTTTWVNGEPRSGTRGVDGLKPGQVRAGRRVYEPYQVLRPDPRPAPHEGVTP